MITPDLPLAKAITTAVLDQIERSRTISSSGIEEVVYAKLVYANAVAPVAAAAAPSDGPEIMLAARALLQAYLACPHYINPSPSVTRAAASLDRLLRERGV